MSFDDVNLLTIVSTAICTAVFTAICTWIVNYFLTKQKERQQRRVILVAVREELQCYKELRLKPIIDFLSERTNDFRRVYVNRTFFPAYENNVTMISAIEDANLVSQIVNCYGAVYEFLDKMDILSRNADEGIQVSIRARRGLLLVSEENPNELLQKHFKLLDKAFLSGKSLTENIQTTVGMINQCLVKMG